MKEKDSSIGVGQVVGEFRPEGRRDGGSVIGKDGFDEVRRFSRRTRVRTGG